MTMGLFGTFIILLFKLYDPVRKFAYFYNSFQQAMGASASIFIFFDNNIGKNFSHELLTLSAKKLFRFFVYK